MLKGATSVSSLRGHVADAAGLRVGGVGTVEGTSTTASPAHGLNQHSGHRRSGKLRGLWAANLTCISSETTCFVSFVFLASRD